MPTRSPDARLSRRFSEYFPADILIGWVEQAELDDTKTTYRVRVRLAAEISSLSDVILVENTSLAETRRLRESERVKQQNERE